MNKGQKQIDNWFKEQSWEYWTPHEILARLTEEVGELARLVNHEYGPKPKKSTERKQEFEEEIGDILYTLACFSNVHQIDLEEALEASIKKSESRDINRFKPL
jgi:NTP pyrophosphatase (non-canonical NTP hydrolase)